MPSQEEVLNISVVAQSKAAKIKAAPVIAACFGVLVLIVLIAPGTRGGRSDFLSYYAGAQLAGTPNLYSVARVHAIQARYANPGEIVAFTRLPYQAALLWPLGKLPYRPAYFIWQALNLLAVAGFIWLWAGRVMFVPLCCLYFPMWVSFYSGQDVPLVLVSVALGAFLLRKDKHFVAGLVFALCAIKFHLLLLLPLLIIGKRLWRFAAGLLTAGAAEAGVSLWAGGGWDWPFRYISLLQLNEKSEAGVERMINLNGLLHRLPHAWVWLTLASALVAWGAWRVIRQSRMEVAIGAMLCGGVLVGLHGYMVDAAFLLPLFVTLADDLGLGRVSLISGLIGFSAAAASSTSTALIPQLALVAIFGWLVFFTREGKRTSTGTPVALT